MKVALITEIISHYRLPVFNSIAASGIDLLVLYLRENVPQRQWETYKVDITHRYQILPGIHVATGPSRHAYINPTVSRILAEFNPKVIVCGGYNHTAALQSLWFARQHRTTFILWSESTLKDMRPNRRVYEIYKRWIVRSCDRWLASGTAAQEYLVSLGATSAQIWIAPDAVNNRWFERATDLVADRSSTVLLYVGRLIPLKGLPILLEAVSTLSRRYDIELRIVGDGSERESLEAWCYQHNLAQVKFLDFVQPKQIARHYWDADVFVFPTQSDPWGLVLNEAMVAGLPILSSTAAGAVDDLVIEGFNGFTFAPNDVASLTLALEKFLTLSHESQREMGKHSTEIIQHFTPERCAQGFIEAMRGEPNRAWNDYLAFRKTLEPMVAL